MEYPFYYKGRPCGKLSAEESGIYTVLRVEAEGIEDSILRISVCGDGREYRLGVAESRDGYVLFEKKLSRSAMKELPHIEYAAESGGKAAEARRTDEKRDKRERKTIENGALVWIERADGSLAANDGISDIIALPADIRGGRAKNRIKMINGRGYMLFRY